LGLPGAILMCCGAGKFLSLGEIAKIVNLGSEISDGRGREGSAWSTDNSSVECYAMNF
jgi:hypothetical protein